MRAILLILFTLVLKTCFCQVQVRGYYRSNGTYVQPHVRTSPNSTVTDNYSYPGNYNPNTNSITPTPSYRSSNNTNSSNNGSVWVNGYYRSDGTYVKGYYRSSPSNNNTSPSYQYVKAIKVNVRTSPALNSEIYKTYEFNQPVKVVNTIDDWSQVELSNFNSYTNSYETTYGYIKTSLLNDTYNVEYPSENSYYNSTTSANNSYTSPSYQYVKAIKVNVRTSPTLNSEIYRTYEFNQRVKVVNIIGDWSQVELSNFNSYTNSYESTYGYIKTNLLNDTYNSEYPSENKYNNATTNEVSKNDLTPNRYIVISDKAYFHNEPDKQTIRKGYLLNGEKITAIATSKYFIYIVFTNIYGQTSKGWIRKDDLQSQ